MLASSLFSLAVFRRNAKLPLIKAAKISNVIKAAGEGDLADAGARALQHNVRDFEAIAVEILDRAHAHDAFEGAAKIVFTDVASGGQLLHGEF